MKKQYNLPWHVAEHYWISVYPGEKALPAATLSLLQQVGFTRHLDGAMVMKTARNWKLIWDQVSQGIAQAKAYATVTTGEKAPSQRLVPDQKTVIDPAVIAPSMWVGDALLEDRIVCYLQPVMTAKNQVFGYESFARVKTTDGRVIDGREIVNASKILGIEHMIDRHLHVQAITTFAGSEFNGFLFINFFPGFIHRPAVYLEGLGETAKRSGMIAKHVVLDVTKAEASHDLMHIKNVVEYGRSCGYSVALDDIASVDVARKLVKEIRPDFVKIDMHLVHQVLSPAPREQIRTIVGMVHAAGGTVIAEGVESQEIHDALKVLEIDLFQGYLFSPPVPVETVIKRKSVGG